MSSAYATTINFDQRDSGATGTISYDGAGGALMGEDITFSFVSSPGFSSVDCSGCLLNFTTGGFDSRTGDNYTFNGGGSFELTGAVLDGGSTIANGTLLTGTFNGDQTFSKINSRSGGFIGDGMNTVNDDLAAYFGIGPGSDFMFLTTNFSIQDLTYNGQSFDGNVSAADLATTNVPEPQELGIFGLGLALMMFGLAYRRKNGSNLG